MVSTTSESSAFVRAPGNHTWRSPTFHLYVMAYEMGYDSTTYAAAVQDGIPAWNDIPGANFSITTSKERVSESNVDYTSTVSFHNINSVNHLAEATNSTIVEGGVTYYVATDIVFDSSPPHPWELTKAFVDATPVHATPMYSNYSVVGVSQHELAHSLGFIHENRFCV